MNTFNVPTESLANSVSGESYGGPKLRKIRRFSVPFDAQIPSIILERWRLYKILQCYGDTKKSVPGSKGDLKNTPAIMGYIDQDIGPPRIRSIWEALTANLVPRINPLRIPSIS